ncbi:MAG: modulator of FtsH protease HflK [Acetobacteraceae bacterium]|jgi:modulator of FtsH protease HflK|nr:modulator of FtsH protease HflK [Acetobacteraceae bacterium]MEA2776540.1 modulator of FtsH protease HflK [Acetobacteraceae bacterium]
MPWNNGGPGPWGNPPGSSGGDKDKKPTPGPWGNLGGNKGPKNDDGEERPEPERGPRRPGGPFGGGGGPFGNGPFGGGAPPDLDRLIAQLQGYIRGLLGGGFGGGKGGGSFGGFGHSRGLILLLLGIVVLWVGSGIYKVQPDEQGVVMRFGAYAYWTPPGLHWHLPWPFESVQQPTVTRINRTEIGYRSGTGGNVESGRDATGRDVLAESLMLTGDENIIDIDVAVFWRINDASAFLFNTANPETLVRAVAESSMREVIGRTPIQPALTQLRAQIESDVLKQTQEILDRYKAGVEVTQVQLQKVDPPAAVIESFRDVQRANTDAERMRNEAESYRNDIVPRARGDAARIVAEGQGAKAASVAQANGQAQRFESVLKAYQVAKEVTLRRMYLDTMQDVLAHSQPLVIDDKLKGLVPFLPLNVPPPTATLPAAPASSASQGANR